MKTTFDQRDMEQAEYRRVATDVSDGTICPTCNGMGWAWQWRKYGDQQYHGEYYEPCDDCAKTDLLERARAEKNESVMPK